MLLGATEDQKRAADPAALQGQMILSHHVYARNWLFYKRIKNAKTLGHLFNL